MALIHDDNDYIQLSRNTTKWMRSLGKSFPNAGFGNMFYDWLFASKPESYESYGNGAGMRVSACGIVGKNLEEVKRLSPAVTQVTHNHPESYRFAERAIDTTPEAIVAILVSNSFEDTIRNGISIGRELRYHCSNDWRSWQTTISPSFSLSAGLNPIRLRVARSGSNLNYFQLMTSS